MNKTVTVLIVLILLILIGVAIFGGINFRQIQEKVTSVKTDVTSTQDSIKETIKNINQVKDAIAEARIKIDQTNIDLLKMNDKLKVELARIKSSVRELEEIKKTLDMEILAIKNRIPGEPKELKEPEYQRLGVLR